MRGGVHVRPCGPADALAMLLAELRSSARGEAPNAALEADLPPETNAASTSTIRVWCTLIRL